MNVPNLCRQAGVATASFLLFVLVSVSALPQHAHAQGSPIVLDPTNLIQNTISAINDVAGHTLDYVLNGLAWEVANLAIESMTKSTVNWINSGFQGSPAFVTDLNENLRGVSDAIADRFFDELAEETIGRTDLQDPVLDAVRLGYYLRTSPESFYNRYPYTLNQVSADDQAFLRGDFRQGGWNAWVETVMNPRNNPYGVNLLLNEELEARIGNGVSVRTQELDWSKGFLSWRGDCIKHDTTSVVALTGTDTCYGYEVQTPGSVIEDQLNDALKSGKQRLVVADDFNEIISALLNQLVGQVLGGSDGGLRGVSRPSSGGGSSFVDRATDPTQNPGNSRSTSAAFAATVADQRKILETFQANWEKIRTAAEAARAQCTAAGNSTPEQVVVRAQEALVKAANGIAAYRDLESRIAAANTAGGNQTAAISGIVNDFTALSRSSTIPSAEEIAEAQTQSQDTGTARPGSLYSQMSRLAANNCRAGE